MYLSPECPNIDEISTGLTFCRTKIVANVCLAQCQVMFFVIPAFLLQRLSDLLHAS